VIILPQIIDRGETMNETELISRLEKLERDNRRLKRFGAAALVLAAGLVLAAATQPIPDVIRAHKFEVVDGAGKVGMRLSVSSEGANIFIAPGILSAPGGKKVAAVSIGAFGTNSWVTLGNAAWGTSSTETQPVVGIMPFLGLNSSQAGTPSVTLRDAQGFGLDLGSTSTQTLATGETQKTSAASIVMFGNDKERKVVWQAP
jgi:hypothetical protein